MRSTGTPNKTEQDGPSEYWLCDECEGRFGRAETSFSREFFKPANDSFFSPTSTAFGPDTQYFCASVSWRSLRFNRRFDLQHLRAGDEDLLAEAELVWRKYLLGLRNDIAPYFQGLFVLQPVLDLNGGESPVLNQFFSRAVMADVVADDNFCIVLTKMMGVVVIGVIRNNNEKAFENVVVSPSSGVAKTDYTLPRAIWEYFSERADFGQNRLDGISATQQTKIEERLGKLDSESFWRSTIGQARSLDDLGRV